MLLLLLVVDLLLLLIPLLLLTVCVCSRRSGLGVSRDVCGMRRRQADEEHYSGCVQSACLPDGKQYSLR